MLRLAETQVEWMSAVIEHAQKELEALRLQLDRRTVELAGSKRRVVDQRLLLSES